MIPMLNDSEVDEPLSGVTPDGIRAWYLERGELFSEVTSGTFIQ